MIKTSNERANEIALKQRFLDRAKALSNLAEVFRCPQVRPKRQRKSAAPNSHLQALAAPGAKWPDEG